MFPPHRTYGVLLTSVMPLQPSGFLSDQQPDLVDLKDAPRQETSSH